MGCVRGLYSDSFIALGLQVSLLCGPEPGLALESKPGRIEDVLQLMNDVTMASEVSSEELRRLRGKLGFMTGWLSSRLVSLATGRIQLVELK
eukprot:3800656-Amphidinium_carterae.1